MILLMKLYWCLLFGWGSFQFDLPSHNPLTSVNVKQIAYSMTVLCYINNYCFMVGIVDYFLYNIYSILQFSLQDRWKIHGPFYAVKWSLSYLLFPVL